MKQPLVAILSVLVACGGSSGGPTDPGIDPAGPDAPLPPPGMATAQIPAPTGVCPVIANGDVTFAPAGIAPRKIKLALPATTAKGPLIIYWHATGSGPAEAAYSLGATLTAFTDAGGIVAAPYADPTAGQFEWFIVNGGAQQDDFVVADELVACLAQAGRLDAGHVHSMGMSAGGLQTTAFSFARAPYVASVATYSGGIPDGFMPVNAAPANKFAALIFDGGATDDVFGVDFQAASQTYRAMLQGDGHFTAICDHGKGHDIPLDAAPSVALFFAANGFGVSPSPYASGLPASFPSYCSL